MSWDILSTRDIVFTLNSGRTSCLGKCQGLYQKDPSLHQDSKTDPMKIRIWVFIVHKLLPSVMIFLRKVESLFWTFDLSESKNLSLTKETVTSIQLYVALGTRRTKDYENNNNTEHYSSQHSTTIVSRNKLGISSGFTTTLLSTNSLTVSFTTLEEDTYSVSPLTMVEVPDDSFVYDLRPSWSPLGVDKNSLVGTFVLVLPTRFSDLVRCFVCLFCSHPMYLCLFCPRPSPYPLYETLLQEVLYHFRNESLYHVTEVLHSVFVLNCLRVGIRETFMSKERPGLRIVPSGHLGTFCW